jgi:aspartate ammonia-lyase
MRSIAAEFRGLAQFSVVETRTSGESRAVGRAPRLVGWWGHLLTTNQATEPINVNTTEPYSESEPVKGVPTTGGGPTRVERDSLGSMEVPRDALWGIHTARALRNFPVTRRPISVYTDLIVALAQVKKAAARANKELGVLDAAKADVISQVCDELIAGKHHDQFLVGVIQGGAGTSTNMNVN